MWMFHWFRANTLVFPWDSKILETNQWNGQPNDIYIVRAQRPSDPLSCLTNFHMWVFNSIPSNVFSSSIVCILHLYRNVSFSSLSLVNPELPLMKFSSQFQTAARRTNLEKGKFFMHTTNVEPAKFNIS